MVTPGFRGLALMLSVWALFACARGQQDAPDTGIIVVVRSDMKPELELDELVLETRREDGVHRAARVGIKRAEGEGGRPTLPLSFVVYANDDDIAHGVLLTVTGLGPTDLAPRVRRTARLHFRRGELLRLILDLTRACEDRFLACEELGKTCEGDGGCIEDLIDPAALEVIAPGVELGSLPLFDAQSAMQPRAVASEPDGGTRGSGSLGRPKEPVGAQKRPASEEPRPARFGPDETGPEAPSSGPIPSTCEDGVTRCTSDALELCVDGKFVVFQTCESGCSADGETCAACRVREHACDEGLWTTCRDGSSVTLACPLGCSASTPRCEGCSGAPDRCEPDGTLRSCRADGGWVSTTCYADCAGGPEAEAGTLAELDWAGPPAACAACGDEAGRCDGRNIVACGTGGVAVPVTCYFGCDQAIACREDTPLGHALLSVVFD